MDLKLKNIKLNLTFSQETIMFNASLYLGNKRIAYCSNDGHGGNTDISKVSSSTAEFKAAEEYCLSLPPVEYMFGEEKHSFPMTLDLFVDELLNKHVQETEEKRFAKRMQKDMINGLLYGDDKHYKVVQWEGHTIASLTSMQKGREALKEKIKEIQSKGGAILNTNIPEELLNN